LSGTDAAPPAGRNAHVDRLRGAAILLMVVYHAAWDANFLGLVDVDVEAPLWRGLRIATLVLFLGLVGVSLDLAAARGLSRRAILRRFALLAGSAVLVSATSALFFPNGLITFGVLHCIAVASLLALPFLRLPIFAAAAAGAVILALGALQNPAFDTPWLSWLGFATRPAPARDYVPLVPWFGVVLLGLAFGRLIDIARRAVPAPRSGGGRLLAAAGRNSLVIYLVHQPAIYVVLLGLAAILGHAPGDTADFERAFRQSCREQCLAGNVGPEVCTARCECVLGAIRREIRWRDLTAGAPSAATRARLDALVQSCTESHVEGRDRR
jgi:uncharacterized membrane protein